MLFRSEGPIEHRDEETYNPKIPTGTIELEAKTVTVLGKVYTTLPFEIQSEAATEAGIFRDERNGQLYEAMEKLKKEYQEALYLVYFEDMSYKEAGKVLGRSESQVTNLVHRGKKSLKEILRKEGFEYDD